MATDAVVPAPVREPIGLWLALFAGPAAASIQLSVNYALVKWACASDGTWVLVAIAIGLLAVTIAGGTLGMLQLAAVRGEDRVARTWSADSRRLLAITAVALNGFIAIFLINVLIAMATLTPCE